MIGVPVDTLQSVRCFLRQEVQPHLEVGQVDAGLISGTVMLPEMEQRVLLLDAQALVQRWPESTLSQSSGSSRSALRASAAGLDEAEIPATNGSYVVFSARQAWAAPMSLLCEIMPYPMSFRSADSSQDALLGHLEWRGRSLPMLDLRVLTQQPRRAPEPQSKVLVVAVGDQHAALVVDDVHELLAAHLCVHTRWTLGGGLPVHMVTVGQGADQKSYRVIDFPALAFLSDLA
jgi:purine-binding chemotaxis protein CheW